MIKNTALIHAPATFVEHPKDGKKAFVARPRTPNIIIIINQVGDFENENFTSSDVFEYELKAVKVSVRIIILREEIKIIPGIRGIGQMMEIGGDPKFDCVKQVKRRVFDKIFGIADGCLPLR